MIVGESAQKYSIMELLNSCHIVLELLRRIQFSVDADVVTVYCNSYNNNIVTGNIENDRDAINKLLTGDISVYKKFIVDSVDKKISDIADVCKLAIRSCNDRPSNKISVPMIQSLQQIFCQNLLLHANDSIIASRLKTILLSLKSLSTINAGAGHNFDINKHTDLNTECAVDFIEQLTDIAEGKKLLSKVDTKQFSKSVFVADIQSEDHQSLRQKYEMRFDALESAMYICKFFDYFTDFISKEAPCWESTIDERFNYFRCGSKHYTRKYNKVSVDAMACMNANKSYTFEQCPDDHKKPSLSTMTWVALNKMKKYK